MLEVQYGVFLDNMTKGSSQLQLVQNALNEINSQYEIMDVKTKPGWEIGEFLLEQHKGDIRDIGRLVHMHIEMHTWDILKTENEVRHIKETAFKQKEYQEAQKRKQREFEQAAERQKLSEEMKRQREKEMELFSNQKRKEEEELERKLQAEIKKKAKAEKEAKDVEEEEEEVKITESELEEKAKAYKAKLEAEEAMYRTQYKREDVFAKEYSTQQETQGQQTFGKAPKKEYPKATKTKETPYARQPGSSSSQKSASQSNAQPKTSQSEQNKAMNESTSKKEQEELLELPSIEEDRKEEQKDLILLAKGNLSKEEQEKLVSRKAIRGMNTFFRTLDTIQGQLRTCPDELMKEGRQLKVPNCKCCLHNIMIIYDEVNKRADSLLDKYGSYFPWNVWREKVQTVNLKELSEEKKLKDLRKQISLVIHPDKYRQFGNLYVRKSTVFLSKGWYDCGNTCRFPQHWEQSDVPLPPKSSYSSEEHSSTYSYAHATPPKASGHAVPPRSSSEFHKASYAHHNPKHPSYSKENPKHPSWWQNMFNNTFGTQYGSASSGASSSRTFHDYPHDFPPY